MTSKRVEKEVFGVDDVDMNQEKATAEAILALKSHDFKQLKVLTDLSESQVNNLVRISTFSEWLKTNKLDNTVCETFVKEYVTYRVNKNRKSRKEILDSVKAPEIKEDRAGLREKLRGLLP